MESPGLANPLIAKATARAAVHWQAHFPSRTSNGQVLGEQLRAISTPIIFVSGRRCQTPFQRLKPANSFRHLEGYRRRGRVSMDVRLRTFRVIDLFGCDVRRWNLRVTSRGGSRRARKAHVTHPERGGRAICAVNKGGVACGSRGTCASVEFRAQGRQNSFLHEGDASRRSKTTADALVRWQHGRLKSISILARWHATKSALYETKRAKDVDEGMIRSHSLVV